MVARKRRVQRYSDEFRNKALARLVNETRGAIAKDLDISSTLLTRWKAERDNPKKPTASKLRKFTDEFKRAAIERVRAGELQEEVAKQLGVGSSLISAWKTKFAGKKLPTN